MFTFPVSHWAVGYKNTYSMLFDGVDETMSCSNDSSLNFTGNFSFSAWIYITDLTHKNTIFFRSQSAADLKGYTFEIQSTGIPRLIINGAAENLGITTLLINTWYHVVFTKATGATPTFYLNGVDDTGGVDTTNPSSNTGTSLISDNIWGAGRLFEGNIDGLSVWNVTLTATDVTDIYNSGKPNDLNTHAKSANLVGWWRMGEGGTWDGTNWTIPNAATGAASGGAAIDAISTNMEEADRVTTIP